MMSLKDFQEILRVIRPFIPGDRLQGPTPGLVIDNELDMLSAARNEGGIFYSIRDERKCASKSLILPKEYVDRLLRLTAVGWEGIAEADTQFLIRAGRLRMTFSAESKAPVMPPDFCGLVHSEIPQEFLENLSTISRFMCTDDRRLNVYGIYAGEDALYACDNVRATKLFCTIPESLRNVFLPLFCVNTIIKNREIQFGGVLQNELVFTSKNDAREILQFFLLLNAKFPEMERAFQRLLAEESIEILSKASADDLKEFMDISFSDLLSTSLEVSLEGYQMKLTSFSERVAGQDSIMFESQIESTEPLAPQKFVVDISNFLSGLSDYPYLKLCKDAVVMQDKLKKMLYVVMKKSGV